jgi:hypothetical protein
MKTRFLSIAFVALNIALFSCEKENIHADEKNSADQTMADTTSAGDNYDYRDSVILPGFPVDDSVSFDPWNGDNSAGNGGNSTDLLIDDNDGKEIGDVITDSIIIYEDNSAN